MAIEMTVEPELLSTIVFVLPGSTPFSNKFIAAGISYILGDFM